MLPEQLLDFLTAAGRLRVTPRHCYTAPIAARVWPTTAGGWC